MSRDVGQYIQPTGVWQLLQRMGVEMSQRMFLLKEDSYRQRLAHATQHVAFRNDFRREKIMTATDRDTGEFNGHAKVIRKGEVSGNHTFVAHT